MISRTRLTVLLALALPVIVAPVLHAQNAPQPQQQDDSEQNAQAGDYQGENPDRYAMVRALDGNVRITKGDVQDTLTKGTPVGEGDVVESSGRGVLQLADGTRVAFADNTKFTVASLFTDKDGTRQVLLRLDRGRLRLRVDDDSDARLRIDTPSGSVICSNRATFNVDVDADGVARISVTSGHVRVNNQRDDAGLGAGEQLSVFGSQDPLTRIRAVNTYDQDDFDRWSDNAWTVRRGDSWDRVPSDIRYYSDDLDSNGSWVQSDEYGWVWRPRGVAADWRPYYQGRWAAYPGGMTWISYDPWAYVTYHHGRWAFAGGGWCWIPGAFYSPAWVAWSYNGGYCGWAPLNYYNAPCTWGYGAWGGGYCWNVVQVNYINVYNVNRYCSGNGGVIRGFNQGTGASAWAPNRGTNPPWRTRPLMATSNEFRNPGQFNRAFQPGVERERMVAYQARAGTTGRQVYYRPADSGGRNGGSPSAPQSRVPFEDRGAVDRMERNSGQPGNTRPGNTGIVPPDRRTNGGSMNGGTTNRPSVSTPPRDPQPRQDNNGQIPNRGGLPTMRENPREDNPRNDNPRPTPPVNDRRATPDRSFDRDSDRPAPRREAPPMREAPRQEGGHSAPRESSRSEAPRGNSRGNEKQR